MGVQRYQKRYEGSSITTPRTGVIVFKAPANGTIDRLDLYVGQVLLSPATFQLYVNGVAVFSNPNRPVIATATASISKTGLAFAVSRGDEIALDLVHSSTPSTRSPITLTLSIDEAEAVALETASVDDLETATGTIALGRLFILRRLVASGFCRVRLYKTSAARSADAAREFGDTSYAGTEHGLILDLLLDAATGLDWILSPDAIGSNGDDPQVNAIYYAIENRTGSAGAITVNFFTARI